MSTDKPQGFAVLPSHIVRDPEILPQVKAVLLVLASYASADNQSWPSHATIAAVLGVSVSSVRAWLDVAQKAGLLTVVQRYAPDLSQTSNAYRLTFERWGGVSAEQQPPCQPTSRPPVSGLTTSKTNEQDQKNNTPIVPKGDALELKPDKVDLIVYYNASCPNMPQCRGAAGSAARKAADKAWKREPDSQLWLSRFKRAQASDFLAGRRGSFRADFLWLTNQTNVEKLDMGRYDNRGGFGARGNAPTRTDEERAAMAEQDFSDFDAAIGWKEGE